MKDTYRIFVEGIADKRFIEQLLESVFSQNIPSDNIIKTDGYTNLTATKKEQTFINEMLRTTDDGGINLVIFDADSNCERRRTELLDWKRRSKVDFELFLLPDNANSGELEDLLMQTINPVNQPVMECWNKYEESLKGISLPWKGTLTLPAKKTRIYAYLEALLGPSRSEKEMIKEAKRDYKNENHWNLKAQALSNLIDFLKKNLSSINQDIQV